MKAFYLILSIIISTAAISQDERCPYVPIEFEGMNISWRHQTTDSTILDFIDTTAIFEQTYRDETDHLGSDHLSFVDDGYLYSIVTTQIDADIAGFLIEKINVETGKVMWKIIEDTRINAYREFIWQAEVQDDRLVTYGMRLPRPDSLNDPPMFPFLFAAGCCGIYTTKEYDLETGERLFSFTPPLGDTLAPLLSKSLRFSHNYFSRDSVVSFADKINFLEGIGLSLCRDVTGSDGRFIRSDTVVVSRFVDRPIFDGVIQEETTFSRTPENTYLYLETYYPEEDINDTYEAILSEYDKDFNLLREIDLKTTFDFPIFSQIGIVTVTEGAILLKGCSTLDIIPNYSPCDEFFMILDRSFNVTHRFEVPDNTIARDKIFDSGIYLDGQEKVMYFDQVFNEEGPSFLDIYESENEGTLNLVKRFPISIPDWVGFVDRLLVLEGGDFLMRFTHSCYIDGEKNSWHPEWFRIPREEIFEPVSTQEITTGIDVILSPNPVLNVLSVELASPLIGKVEIQTLNGQLVHQSEISESQTWATPVQSYPAGMYVWRLVLDTGEQVVKKFVKR